MCVGFTGWLILNMILLALCVTFTNNMRYIAIEIKKKVSYKNGQVLQLSGHYTSTVFMAVRSEKRILPLWQMVYDVRNTYM